MLLSRSDINTSSERECSFLQSYAKLKAQNKTNILANAKSEFVILF